MKFVRSDIATLQGYVPGEQPPPGKIIKLNTNENPYPPSARVVAAIGETLHRGLQRYPDPMATAFRMRAAELCQLEPDWILCGNGSDELLTIAMRTFVAAGQLVRYPMPSYTLYATLAAIQAATAQQIRFNPDWTLPAAFRTPDSSARLVLLANPNSPSGTMVRPGEVRELAQALPCPLLVDEAYVDFADDNCLSLVKEADNILVTRSLSKSYALAGLRFGFIVAQPQLIAQMAKVKESYNCDALAIAGATAAIDDRQWLETTRAKIVATRQRLTLELTDLGFAVTPSEANFVWCTFPGRPVRPLFEQLKRQRVLVRYMDYHGWGDGLRISVGTDGQIDACLVILRSIIN